MTLRTHPVTPSGRNPAGQHNPHIRPTHHVRPRHTPPTTSANGPAAPRRNRLSSGRERHPSNRTRVARGRPPHEVTPGEATTHEEAMSLARAPACTRGPDPGRDRSAQGDGPREGPSRARGRAPGGSRPYDEGAAPRRGAAPGGGATPRRGAAPGGSRPHDERAPRRVVTARSRTAPRCRPYQGPARSDRSPHDRAARTRPQGQRGPHQTATRTTTGPQPTRRPRPHRTTAHPTTQPAPGHKSHKAAGHTRVPPRLGAGRSVWACNPGGVRPGAPFTLALRPDDGPGRRSRRVYAHSVTERATSLT